MKRRFDQVDVFSAVPLLGNPLAVVHAAQGLDDATLAAFARWTNLSETAFLLPPIDPAADYRVRIFTPGGELPFAGHPTLGSCWAWLAAGGQPQTAGVVVQECGVGLVRVRRQGQGQGQGVTQRLAFAAPPLRRSGPLDAIDLALIARALRLSAEDIVSAAWCDNGPGWCAVLLSSAAAVLAVEPDAANWRGHKLGLVGPHPAGNECDFEVRALYPMPTGLCEDPVTGSLNASVAQWLIGAGLAPPRYVAAQGARLGRAGRVTIEQDGADIWVGGEVAACVAGEVTL